MTAVYEFCDSLYLNLTNRCPCRCTFCIREKIGGVGTGGNLWLEREPPAEEIVLRLAGTRLDAYREIVFCGYGEPTERLEVLLEICRYVKTRSDAPPVRLNTNGLSDLIHDRKTAPELVGLVDAVSVSLNAPDALAYRELVRPLYGEPSFAAMLRFAAHCRRLGIATKFTVVDVLEPEDIERCRALADRMRIPLRVRAKQ